PAGLLSKITSVWLITSGEEAVGSRVPGVWGSWGSWSACSQPCGLGVLERTRSCQSPYQRDPWPWPQRPPTGGGSRTPAQKVIPLYKPASQGGRDGGSSQEEEPRGSWPDGHPLSWAASPIPDSQAAWRSRVRESIKPGKYGYGRVPFALPLHKEPAEESSPPAFPEDPGTATGRSSRPSGGGDSAAPSSPPGSIPGSPPAPQEAPPSVPHASGSSLAEEAALAPAGGSSSRRPPPPGSPPPHAPNDPRQAPQVPQDRDKGPGRGPSPRATQGRPPRQPPRLGLDPHLPPSRGRSRNQRQHQPRGSGRGPRPSPHLFVDQPAPRGPAEPDLWLLHGGSPVPLHAGGRRAQAEPPQWNLYAPGTETFHCPGQSRQFRACRQQPCPPDRPDPRAVQCSAYNDQEFMGRFYQWEPFTDGESFPQGGSAGGVWGSQRCELNCRPLGYRFYVRHTEKVQDGTPCEASSQDICVAGQCLTPGCDGILGSNRTLDKCGVCGGDHTTCKLVSGNYSETNVPIGYHRILQIPAGAAQIQVREMSRSPNYLALRTQNGQSVINGNWAVNPPGRYEAAGTVFVYSDREEGELLTAEGPTTKALDLYMIFQQDNPGVSYQFLLAQPEGFVWRRLGNTECSASCGKGSWQAVYRCVSRASQEEVGEEKCHPVPKPPGQEEICNTDPCPAFWDAGGWSACSRSCGPGTQHRQVLCRQIYANRTTMVHPQRCSHLEKPAATQDCQVLFCSHWQVQSNWSSCSVLCGTGHRTRHVRCVSNHGELLRDTDCPDIHRPQSTEPCNMGPCVRSWFYSDWKHPRPSSASSSFPLLGSCGCRKIWEIRRSVVCLSGNADGQADEDCATPKPAEMRACDGGPCQRVTRWYKGPWSSCSAECGPGTQRRDIVCVSKQGTRFSVTEASECAHLEKPPSLQPCTGTDCEARWFSTAWSTCSRSCMGGVQAREAQCLTQNKTLSTLCLPHLKPATKRPCNSQPCLPSCRDKYPNCAVIVQARLCVYSYYKAACCVSCSHALEATRG
uniref:ADAMTS like 4 n=1 Tax=Pseudonaja textilis TaxID=8673 RepID=A0A670ZRE7_PSETE